jgi:hypothetical protein
LYRSGKLRDLDPKSGMLRESEAAIMLASCATVWSPSRRVNMKPSVKILLIVGLIAADSSVVLAQRTRTAASDEQDRLICRRMPETGSLVRARRQCFTRAQWDRIAESQRRGASRMIHELNGGINTNN